MLTESTAKINNNSHKTNGVIDNTALSAAVSAEPLTPEHVAELLRSSITAELAISLGIRSASEYEVCAILNRPHKIGSGMVIPYPDPDGGGMIVYPGADGQPVEFIRVRLDDPSLAVDKDGKCAKYLSRAGSGQYPYIIPAVAEAIRNGTDDIIIVEGEKKAISAYAAGFNAIGLSGNWGWKVKDKFELAPLLDKYLKPRMSITIIWDSDAALNTGFAISTRMLHDCLRKKGCTVKVIVLPQTGKSKVGLDDFIVANGADALRHIINGAPSLPVERMVTVNELITAWYPSLLPALQSLPEDEAGLLFFEQCGKGFVDGIDCTTRQTVLNSIRQLKAFDVDRLFNNAVRGYLHKEFPDITVEDGQATCSAGQKAKDADGRLLKITSVTEGIAWVTDAKYTDTSKPVPASLLTVIPDVHAAALADEFIAMEYADADGELLLRHHRDTFARWTPSGYVEMADLDLKAQVMGFLRSEYTNQATPAMEKAVIENLKAAGLCHIPSSLNAPCILDGDCWREAGGVISFRNGNLDIDALFNGAPDNEAFTGPTPKLYTLTGRNYDFDPDAECPRFSKFLSEIQHAGEVRALLQEMAGYLLIADTSHQRFFLLYGNGANGKGVFSDVLIALNGRQNTCSVSLSRFGERFSLWPLTQKLVNIVAEVPAVDQGSLRIAEDKLKAIVSGDPIEVERKNKDILTARPTARLVFSCNELPRLIDRSNGIWRRLVIVPFDMTIPPERQDGKLAARIIDSELPGIFNWAIEGLARLRARGHFNEPAVCRRLKEEHRLTCSPELEFIQEHTAAGNAEDHISVGELYNAYRTFVQANGNTPMSNSRFLDALKRSYPNCTTARRYVEGKQTRVYEGIRFSSDGLTRESD